VFKAVLTKQTPLSPKRGEAKVRCRFRQDAARPGRCRFRQDSKAEEL